MASKNFASRCIRRGRCREMQVCRQTTNHDKFLEESVNDITISEYIKTSDLRHRFRKPPHCAATVDDHGQGDSLLSQNLQSKSSTQNQKMHGFGGCMEKFLSACRSNVNMLIRSTYRRGAKSEYQKMPRTSPGSQADLQQDDTLSCLGRARRWDVRRIFGDIIKIEEDIVASVPRSVLYYV